MHLTDGWVVVIIVVTACLLILSIGIIHIPDDEDDDVRPVGRHRR